MLPRSQRASKTRDALLDAAVDTLRARGLAGFTLEAVAARAQVSKGALLHHFPSKDALLDALLRGLLADFEARVERCLEHEPRAPGRLLRAYVRASYEETPAPLELAAALLVSLAESEALHRLVREDAARWERRLSDDGVPAPRAAVIRQAADASWTDRLMRTGPTDEGARRAVRDELISLTERDDR